MRVDRNSPGGCSIGCATRPIAPFDTMPHGADIAFNQDFLNGFHQILPNVEKIVPEPRIGFAWTPIGDKTVFRGGIGLFTDLYPVAILNAYTNNFPQVNRFVIPAGTVAFCKSSRGGRYHQRSGPRRRVQRCILKRLRLRWNCGQLCGL